MAGKLERYHRKRDFSRTPEPRGTAASKVGALRFVVQKHDARRLHYDLRLEHGGVLKSWAVPKEPSYDPKERRLAVQTEDHPIEYGDFEGEIPEHQYGAGSVVIWDRGVWTPRGDPERGLVDGKLDFELHGERLKGRWTLVRMAERRGARNDKDNWLLIKRSDAGTTRGDARSKRGDANARRSGASAKRDANARHSNAGAERDANVRRSDAAARPGAAGAKRSDARTQSGDANAKHRDTAAKGGDAGAARATPSPRRRGSGSRDLSATPGATRAALPDNPRPQLATAATRPPEGGDWLHEPKLDGYRLLCRIEGGQATLLTRRGNDWTPRFASIARAAAELPSRSALLDGEAVVFDDRGHTDFQQLQNAIATGAPGIVLVAFDLLYLDGWDLRAAPLEARKALLRELLATTPEIIRYGDHIEGNGAEFFREACRLGLEGIIAKRAGDRYREERTRSWLKVKCLQRQEFVIVGFTDPAGSRTGFGALLLGVRRAPGEVLRYAGKVGTGFDERMLRALTGRLEPLVRKKAPVSAASARGLGRRVHWVEPRLVAEIAFTEWTTDGRLRHPTFRGLREDKPAEEVVEERPIAPRAPSEAGAPQNETHARQGVPHAPPNATRAQHDVKLTSPDKVLLPDPGITKRELARYWEDVAEAALPSLQYRPLTLYRCPEGYHRQCFYQKHIGIGVPKAVPRIRIKEDEEPYAMVDGVSALQGLVQIAALELHVWGSRAEHLDQPDIIVFDLDPAEDLPWRAVADAAYGLKERIEALGLAPFARLTGGKGIHLVVPVEPGPAWPSVKRFARTVVNEMVRDEPKRFTASASKSRRNGKIFVDYLRNDRESTAIASYSPRARAGAPVALPVEWDDLDADAREPPRFGLRDVPALVRRRARDPWEGFDAARRSLLE